MDTINISNMNKAEVLAALYNNAKPQGMGWLHYTKDPMTPQEAQKLLDKGQVHFDYLNGRLMKIDLDSDELWSGGYDRDNGTGVAAKALAELSAL